MKMPIENQHVSIRSPHRSKGRLLPLGAVWLRSGIGFNPLPSPKQGETRVGGRLQSRGEVSIRSPHRSKGRPNEWHVSILLIKFQSAPLTEARGDAPRAESSVGYAEFQSAPLTEARGDSVSLSSVVIIWRFNPLPSPKQGETGP